MTLVDGTAARLLEVSSAEVDEILRDDNSLEGILVSLDYISPDQLRKALAIQRQQSPLGEILVEMGAITQEQLKEALMLQKISRGEATDIEAACLYRLQRKRLVKQVVTELRQATDESNTLTAHYQNGHKAQTA